VLITKNGMGDLVVLSLAAWELEQARLALYRALDEAEADVRAGDPFEPGLHAHPPMTAWLCEADDRGRIRSFREGVRGISPTSFPASSTVDSHWSLE
jgi:hypothetical protein